MRKVKLTEDLLPRLKDEVITVDDVSAARVVEAGVGVYLDENGTESGATAETATVAATLGAPATAEIPEAPKVATGRTAKFD
jgi:hypothetical protein